MPSSVAESHTRVNGVSSFAYLATVPGGANRLLIVTVNIGSLCVDPGVATVQDVSFGTAALIPFASITGSPCDDAATRSEL